MPKNDRPAKIKLTKNSAVGPYLGYALQVVRFTQYLMDQEPQKFVSLEYLDDVCVHDEHGATILEQNKSSLVGNPLSDKSIEFWKTILNWLHHITKHGTNNDRLTFRLYVIGGNPGNWATWINDCNTQSEADKIISDLSAFLKQFDKRTGAGKIINAISSCETLKLRYVFINTTILCTKSSPLSPIRKYFRMTQEPETIDLMVSLAIGNTKRIIDDQLRFMNDPLLKVETYQKQFRQLYRKHDLSCVLPELSSKPQQKTLIHTFQQNPVFVQQLSAVNASRNMILKAVSAVLRTRQEFERWAANCLIYAGSVDELFEILVDHFEDLAAYVEIDKAHLADAQKGYAIYLDCCRVQTTIERKPMPPFVIRGSYNELADEIRVWWHPSFSGK